jgi:hypothetical protein
MSQMQIGSLYASIAGDHRYGETLSVTYDKENDCAVITVTAVAPVGGMDGPGGIYPPSVRHREHLSKPTGATLVKLIKRVTGNRNYNFKEYGKPSKRFSWVGVGVGLSATIAKEALLRARSV